MFIYGVKSSIPVTSDYNFGRVQTKIVVGNHMEHKLKLE